MLCHMEPPAWLEPAFGLGAFASTAMLVVVNLNSLALHNFDRLALFFLVLGYPLNTFLRYLQLPFPVPAPVDLSPYYLPISAGLVAYMMVTKPSLPERLAPRPSWLGIGFAGGAVVGLATGLLIRAASPHVYPVHITVGQLILLPVQQFTYAALSEEPVFRGFLWGALRQAGLRDRWIFAVQAVLFWLAHIYYINTYPLSFWLIVPMGAVVMGLLAWRSRSIAPSMIAHGLMNGIGQAAAFYTL